MKLLYNTHHKPQYMDKNERNRLRLHAIRTYRERISNSHKNTHKNPVNPDLSSESGP